MRQDAGFLFQICLKATVFKKFSKNFDCDLCVKRAVEVAWV